jgi:hypothetical protein
MTPQARATIIERKKKSSCVGTPQESAAMNHPSSKLTRPQGSVAIHHGASPMSRGYAAWPGFSGRRVS